jgi:endonuclease/exonuclease/phosphatase family metal-dependent hydrolase
MDKNTSFDVFLCLTQYKILPDQIGRNRIKVVTPVIMAVMEFSVTTLNLYGPNNWENRAPKIIEYLEERSSDIVVLQEVVRSDRISPSHNTAQIIKRALHYKTEVSTVKRPVDDPVYGHFLEGLAILSKHRLIASDTHDLKRAPRDRHTRFTQMATLAIGGREVEIENVHFSLSTPGPNYAAAQIHETFARQAERREKKIIVGDFNMDDIDEVIEEWRDEYTASTELGPHITQYDAIGEGGVLEDRCPDQLWAPKSHYQLVGGVAISPLDLSDHCGASYLLRAI